MRGGMPPSAREFAGMPDKQENTKHECRPDLHQEAVQRCSKLPLQVIRRDEVCGNVARHDEKECDEHPRRFPAAFFFLRASEKQGPEREAQTSRV